MGASGEPRVPWYKQLHWQIALGIVLGFAYGVVVRVIWPVDPGDPSGLEVWKSAAGPFVFLGDLFIRSLKMIIIPLIVASIVTGIRNIGDTSKLGRVGFKTVIYYTATTLLAVIVGMLVVNVIDPGVGLNLDYQAGKVLEPKPLSAVFANIVPTNILDVFAKNDMLPSIFVAILMGVGILSIKEKGEPLSALFESFNALILKITDWIMRLAPIGVGALFVKTLLDPKLVDLPSFLESLGSYMFSVVLGLGIHGLVTLPLILWLTTRRNPLTYIRALSPSLLTAFSTASSSATYPVTLDCVTDRAGVSKENASFVLPLGATINMDGTAIMQGVATVFIAQFYQVGLDVSDYLMVILTATMASIGTAGVPGVGLIMLTMVLTQVGLPVEGIMLIIGVDRILDMLRTAVNVTGDAMVATVVARTEDDLDLAVFQDPEAGRVVEADD